MQQREEWLGLEIQTNRDEKTDSQEDSPSTTTPATNTTANTGIAEEGLGSSELRNSLAEPNPSN